MRGIEVTFVVICLLIIFMPVVSKRYMGYKILRYKDTIIGTTVLSILITVVGIRSEIVPIFITIDAIMLYLVLRLRREYNSLKRKYEEYLSRRITICEEIKDLEEKELYFNSMLSLEEYIKREMENL